MSKKQVSKLVALFCIELILFLPFYVADVYAVKPVLSNIQATTTHKSLNITWETDIPSNSLVDYARDSNIELSRTSQEATTNHSIIIAPLSTNTYYYYRVQSCVAFDCRASSVSRVKTLTAPPPDKIIGLTNKTITPRSIELTWQQSTSDYFGYYIIYRDEIPIANTTQTEYIDPGLDGSTTYLYEVSAANANNIEGEKSDQFYQTTLVPDTTPPTIQNVSISSISSDSATIEWITNEEANSTIVYGITGFDLTQSSLDYKLTHSITLTNLQNDSTYHYKIISCDLDGNCAEKSNNDPFTPSEIRELIIQLNVPLIYNKAVVPVSGLVTPHTKVKFFVNNAYKGLISMERNQDGEIQFDVPGFSSGNNTLKLVLEDSIGNTKQQSYNVFIDISPPILDIVDLPIQTSDPTLIIEGSSSELVDIDIYISLSQAKDTTPPGKISNLHVDEAKENSILLAWTDVEDEDFREYIIYRNNIPIGTTVSSPYLDDYLVSSGKTYSYSIVAVDTSCNMGQKVFINQKTIEGGFVHDEDVEPENIECITGEQTPAYTLEQQYPSFREEITLRQGINKITIKATDRAGNKVQKIYTIYHDSEAPEILETNIDSISPSYVRDVTITGTVSEEAYVCIYINSEVEIKPYREEEVDESAEDIFGESKYCASTENGTFSIDIELRRDPDYAYDLESPTPQTRTMLIRTGTAWRNNIKIIATDRVGLRNDPEEGEEIIYTLCGGGGDWGIIIDDVMPAEITPRHLLEGMAQISFSVDLIWRGYGPKPGIADIDIREGYPMKMSEDLEKTFDKEWVSQIYDDAWSAEFDKGYVLIDLKAQDPDPSDELTTYEKEKNLSQHNQGQCFNVPFTDKSYLEQAGCVRIPLTFMIDYEQKRMVRIRDELKERQETLTQKECMDVEILIQPRIPPDMIPNAFLEGSVEFLNATIEGIDAVLSLVEPVLKATTLACFGMWAGFYVKKATEGFACLGIDINKCSCTPGDKVLGCTSTDKDYTAGDCEKCLNSKISTKTFEKYMHWTCDRVLCPAVPSFETYIDQNQGENSKSNCKGKIGKIDYSDTMIDDKQAKCKYAPKGLVGSKGPIKIENTDCCDEEYMQEWGAGAVMMNELEESRDLAGEGKEKPWAEAWRGISDFKLCKPGGNDTKEINIDGQWFILERNKDYDKLTPEQKKKNFEWDVWTAKITTERVRSGGNLIEDKTEITKIDKENPLTKKGTGIIRIEDCDKYGTNIENNAYKFKNSDWPKYKIETEVTERTLEDLNVRIRIPIGEENLPFDKIIPTPVGESTPPSDEETQLPVEELYLLSEEGNYKRTMDGGLILHYKLQKDQDPKIYELILTPGIEPQNRPYEIRNNKAYKVSGTIKESTIDEYVPERIVQEACSGFRDEYIINPPDSIFRSVQSVCLSGTYSYLKMYKKILGMINSCFQTILITGDGSSGVCQATLSYYVCDVIYHMFSCFKGYSGFGAVGERGETIGFLKGIVGSGAEVQKAIQGRYGDTNMFNVMFVDRKLLHSACMGFFGADTDIDIMSMAEQVIEMPVRSTVVIMPANRRFIGYNPINGITNHVYHVGLMIVSGSDNMRYEVDLVCSTDNSCDSRYFENGLCDCAYGGEEITKDITNAFGGNGRLDQAEILNEEAYVPMSYDVYDARIRYDKARITYDYLDNKGLIQKEVVERKLSQIGGEPFVHCSFDILSGTYRCSIFEEPTTACFVDELDIYFNGEKTYETPLYATQGSKLDFRFKAKKESKTGREDERNFFAVLEIKDGSRTILSREQVIIDYEKKPYSFKDIPINENWFKGSVSYGCSVIPSSGDKNMALSSVRNCNKDAQISCSPNPDEEGIDFTIQEGTYYSGPPQRLDPDDSNQIPCTLKSSGMCGTYELNFDIKTIYCPSTVYVQKGTSTETTTTADSKELYYTLTIYRPKTDSPRTKSETVARCDNVRQIKEGHLMIHNHITTTSPEEQLKAQHLTISIIKASQRNENISIIFSVDGSPAGIPEILLNLDFQKGATIRYEGWDNKVQINLMNVLYSLNGNIKRGLCNIGALEGITEIIFYDSRGQRTSCGNPFQQITFILPKETPILPEVVFKEGNILSQITINFNTDVGRIID